MRILKPSVGYWLLERKTRHQEVSEWAGLLGRRDNFEAITPVDVRQRFDRAQLQILFHNRLLLITCRSIGHLVKKNRKRKKRKKERNPNTSGLGDVNSSQIQFKVGQLTSLAVDQLAGADGEPPPVPRFESARVLFEEVALHPSAVSHLWLEQRHVVPVGHHFVPVLHLLLQTVGLLPQLRHLQHANKTTVDSFQALILIRFPFNAPLGIHWEDLWRFWLIFLVMGVCFCFVLFTEGEDSLRLFQESFWMDPSVNLSRSSSLFRFLSLNLREDDVWGIFLIFFEVILRSTLSSAGAGGFF